MWLRLCLPAILALSLQPHFCVALGSTARLHSSVLGSTPRLRGGAKQPALVAHQRASAPVAAADSSSRGLQAPQQRARAVLEVGALFAACVSLSLMSDTLTKRVLQQDSSLTVTVTFFHFAMSALAGTVMVPALAWLARSNPAAEDGAKSTPPLPPLSLRDMGVLFPLICCQALGFLFTNLSLKFVTVSFSHTVKACECLFTALLTYMLLGQVVSLPKYLSLLPVAAGVALSSATELQFSAAGFGAAMTSNLLFASRSVLSTRLFQQRSAAASTLYWLMCCGALAMLSPLFLTQISFASLMPHTTTAPLGALALCGLAHFGYNMLSFMILQRTSPITHVILHAVRRILVIGVSTTMLRNQITALNWAGIFVAFVGVLGYSLSP